MGQLADDSINGLCCSDCGCYFEDPNKKDENGKPFLYTHGHPVICKECWMDYTKAERREAMSAGLSVSQLDTI